MHDRSHTFVVELEILSTFDRSSKEARMGNSVLGIQDDGNSRFWKLVTSSVSSEVLKSLNLSGIDIDD